MQLFGIFDVISQRPSYETSFPSVFIFLHFYGYRLSSIPLADTRPSVERVLRTRFVPLRLCCSKIRTCRAWGSLNTFKTIRWQRPWISERMCAITRQIRPTPDVRAARVFDSKSQFFPLIFFGKFVGFRLISRNNVRFECFSKNNRVRCHVDV